MLANFLPIPKMTYIIIRIFAGKWSLQFTGQSKRFTIHPVPISWSIIESKIHKYQRNFLRTEMYWSDLLRSIVQLVWPFNKFRYFCKNFVSSVSVGSNSFYSQFYLIKKKSTWNWKLYLFFLKQIFFRQN